jgi:hypothetical protein
MLERQDWQGAAQLQPLGTGYPMAEAITYFARAMGGARSGDAAAAQADIEKLKEQRAALEKAGQGYWAGQVEIQILAAQGWTAQGQSNKSDALKFMRAAADLEDASEKHVAMENRLYPMRELLADMLLARGQGGGRPERNTRPRSKTPRYGCLVSTGRPGPPGFGRRKEGARVLREARPAHTVLRR